MYGIRSGTDLGFLHGKTLIQVSFGPSDLQLNFEEENVCITVESTIEVGSLNTDALLLKVGERNHTESILRNAQSVLGLLMDVIERVDWEEKGTLNLHFSSGKRLSIFDDSEQYESYTIRHGSELFVV